jgi:putative NADH-flavin reductase
MRIAVFGSAGNVGRRVVAEALARGHEVTAVVRDPARFGELPPSAFAVIGDAGRVEDVTGIGTGQDVVIGATRPVRGREPDLVANAESLLAGLAGTGVRLLLVGGAASLTVPGGGPLLDDPRYLAAEYREIGLACAAQLDVCRAADGVDWTYLSPAALLEPGTRTGRYRLGTDELVVDADGHSVLSMEDLAVVLLDEVERPRHRRARFTAAY